MANKSLQLIPLTGVSSLPKAQHDSYTRDVATLVKQQNTAIFRLADVFNKEVCKKRVENSKILAKTGNSKYAIKITVAGQTFIVTKQTIKIMIGQTAKIVDYLRKISKMKKKRLVRLSKLSGYNAIYNVSNGTLYLPIINLINTGFYPGNIPQTKYGKYLVANNLLTIGGNNVAHLNHYTAEQLGAAYEFLKKKHAELSEYESNEKLDLSHVVNLVMYAKLTAILGIQGKRVNLLSITDDSADFPKSTILSAYHFIMSTVETRKGLGKDISGLADGVFLNVNQALSGNLGTFDSVTRANTLFKTYAQINNGIHSQVDQNGKVILQGKPKRNIPQGVLGSIADYFLITKDKNDEINYSLISRATKPVENYFVDLAFTLFLQVSKNLAVLGAR
jgi:hypothetical protein